MSFFGALTRQVVNSAVANGVNNLMSSNSSYSVPEIPSIVTPYDHTQRVFGQPGISLTFAGDELDEESIKAGISGEKRVANALHELAALYPNTYVFHSVKLPGKLGDMDHMVVQGDRVLLVDAKNWQSSRSYEIVEVSDVDAYILRDGEDFNGGEISLPKQMGEWGSHLIRSANISVLNAVLVVANRSSSTDVGVSVPFMFTNLETLHYAFEVTFSREPYAPLPDYILEQYLACVQGYDYVSLSPVLTVRKPAASGWTISLMIWSIMNYIVAPFLFPLAGLSALTIIVLTHIQMVRAGKRGEGGKVILGLTLGFSYLMFAVWLLGVMFLVMSGILDPTRGIYN